VQFDLASLVKRNGTRRRAILVRDIVPAPVLAGEFYRAVFQPVVEVWAAAVVQLSEMYARTASEMAFDSPADIEREITAIADRAAVLIVTVSPALRRWASRVEQVHRTRWEAAVRASTDIDLAMLIGPDDVRDTLEALIARNAALVADVSAQVRGRISDAVFRGLTERRSSKVVAQQIREAVDMARKRSQRIASDQLQKAHSALSDERRRQAGISTWTWVQSGKAHPRADHVVLDGNVYSDAPSDVGRKIDGDKVVRKPPEARPGTLPFCGCRARSLLLLD
jgi:uncharacterized protein with gpF-like domain